LNKKNRKSFSFQILQCNSNLNPDCKSQEEIKLLMNNLYFNLYTIEKEIEIGGSWAPGEYPIVTKESLQQQFQLNI
jgi:hypothetical protein